MLLEALAPLIGAEEEAGGKAVAPGWAENASKDDIESWAEDGMKLKIELEEYFMEEFAQKYWALMRDVRF
jgi:serine/tyrosine/threonine adenylyltransferase